MAVDLLGLEAESGDFCAAVRYATNRSFRSPREQLAEKLDN
jgi:hypothetical protein